MRCPRCGSENISSIVNTNTHTKGFDGGDACCGYLLFGWPGILCGLCNTGDTTTTIFCYDEFIKSSNNNGFLLQTI